MSLPAVDVYRNHTLTCIACSKVDLSAGRLDDGSGYGPRAARCELGRILVTDARSALRGSEVSATVAPIGYAEEWAEALRKLDADDVEGALAIAQILVPKHTKEHLRYSPDAYHVLNALLPVVEARFFPFTR